jgi:Protein of unknown function (DUF3027)
VPTATRSSAVDQALAEAVDVARAAAAEEAGADGVGEHLGVDGDDERVATHRFAAVSRAYVGWAWSVTLARASRGKAVTVDEVCLLPGAGALLAPPWVPYAERLQPGDLGPGDLLPVLADDDRLEPGWTGGAEALADDGSPDDEVARLAWELGLARERVLSVVGVDDAADRWVNGSGGPHTPLAEAAPASCVTCGFVVRLGGLLGQAFGVCANEYSPSDGHVVTMDHGCGAHSEGGAAFTPVAPAGPVLDSLGYDELSVDGDDVQADDVQADEAADGASEPEDVSDEADVLDVADVPGIDDVVDIDAVDIDDVVDIDDAGDTEHVDAGEPVDADEPADADDLGHG